MVGRKPPPYALVFGIFINPHIYRPVFFVRLLSRKIYYELQVVLQNRNSSLGVFRDLAVEFHLFVRNILLNCVNEWLESPFQPEDGDSP